jgi:hypothetical protein
MEISAPLVFVSLLLAQVARLKTLGANPPVASNEESAVFTAIRY